MSKLEEFEKYVDDQMTELKSVFNGLKDDTVEIAKEFSIEALEVKLTIFEKLKAYIDSEVEAIKKDQEPKA